jgi:hypothetical protein
MPMSPMTRRGPQYLAVIADMVKSRELSSAKRAVVQKHFQELVATLNREYRNSLASKFAITLGDEFQGLLTTSTVIPDLIWQSEEKFPDRQLRVGIGIGSLDTPLQEYAINIDGPALHTARDAIEAAKKSNLLGGVFAGMGSLGEVLNGIARMLWFHRSNWTTAQRTIANLLRDGMMQSEVAERLGISRQVVSKQVAASGWVIYAGGEKAWRMILRDYVDPMIARNP